jgi:hypothetical protein
MFRKPAKYYFGTMRNNEGKVVGFQTGPRQRWCLDFDPDPAKGKWVHVNEENYDAPLDRQKVVHRVDTLRSDLQVRLYYNKWTSQT